MRGARIDCDHVPLAAAEAVRLALVNGFVDHVPDEEVPLVVVDQCVDMIL